METVNNKVSAPTLKNEWLRGEKEMLQEKWFGARSMPSYDKNWADMQNSRGEKQGNKRWEGRVLGERYHIMWKIALSEWKK